MEEMSGKIAIIDYGAGNLNSVKRSLDRVGASSSFTKDPKQVLQADKIVLPGVGHFGRAMSSLKRLGLIEALNEAVLEKGRPILGICLGMELMARRSEEGDSEGFAWLDGEVTRFRPSNRLRYKVPHIGWSRVRSRKESPLMNDVPESSEFYFVHSYYLKLADQRDALNEAQYEFPYPSAIQKGNIFGVQYHPEKSHDAGERLLRNFAGL